MDHNFNLLEEKNKGIKKDVISKVVDFPAVMKDVFVHELGRKENSLSIGNVIFLERKRNFVLVQEVTRVTKVNVGDRDEIEIVLDQELPKENILKEKGDPNKEII